MAKKTQIETLTEEQRMEAIKDSVKTIIFAMGLNVEDDNLIDTPKRVAKYLTRFRGGDTPPDITVFDDDSIDQVVIVRDLEVRSLCAHHLLPFFGSATIGYIPNGKKAGISKFQRVLDYVAERPQDQENITEQIVKMLYETLGASAVVVKLECKHTCMIIRGVKSSSSSTKTIQTRGEQRNINLILSQL